MLGHRLNGLKVMFSRRTTMIVIWRLWNWRNSVMRLRVWALLACKTDVHTPLVVLDYHRQKLEKRKQEGGGKMNKSAVSGCVELLRLRHVLRADNESVFQSWQQR
jgi:hypothetical protein